MDALTRPTERAHGLGPLALWAALTLGTGAVFPVYLVLANFEDARPWVDQAELWCLVTLGVTVLTGWGAAMLRGRMSPGLGRAMLIGSCLAAVSAAAWVEYVYVRSDAFPDYTHLSPGDHAPEVEGFDHRGAPFKLSAWSGPAVLVFYRGQWCPFCYRELQGLKRIEPELRAAGGVIVAVSRETAEAQLAPWQRNTTDPHEAFPTGMRFLADPEGDIISRYGLTAITHGREVARPITVVVDRSGRITWRSGGESWRHRPEPEEVLKHALAAGSRPEVSP